MLFKATDLSIDCEVPTEMVLRVFEASRTDVEGRPFGCLLLFRGNGDNRKQTASNE